MGTKPRLKYWLPVVCWMGFITLMSTETFSAQHTLKVLQWIVQFVSGSVSPRTIALLHEVVRKSAHITEYFISGLLLFRAFRGTMPRGTPWRWGIFSLAVIVLLALSDEFHQRFVSSRTPSLTDVGIDTLGGLLALCLRIAWYYRQAQGGPQQEIRAVPD